MMTWQPGVTQAMELFLPEPVFLSSTRLDPIDPFIVLHNEIPHRFDQVEELGSGVVGAAPLQRKRLEELQECRPHTVTAGGMAQYENQP